MTKITSEWKQVARAKDLDGVIVCTPPALHAEMTTAAIEAGLPVLTEKPLTMDWASSKALLEFAAKKRAFVLVDHIHLFHEAYSLLRRGAQKNGPVRALITEGGNWGPFRREIPPLWDYGPHDVAFCLDLMGKMPQKVEAWIEKGQETPEGGGENVRITLIFTGGVRAEIRVGNLFKSRVRRFEARFSDKALVLNDLKPIELTRHSLIQGALGPAKKIECSTESPLAQAVKTFAQGIKEGRKDLASLALGVDVVEVLERAVAALRQR